MNWTELNCPEQRPKETSSEAEKMRLIKTAAELIKSDVKSVEQSIDMYPCTTEMSSTEEAMSFLPESLKLLFQRFFVGRDADRKVGSLWQAIMQAIRPRVLLAPLQMVGHCYAEFLGILARPMKESPVTTYDMLETGMVTLS